MAGLFFHCHCEPKAWQSPRFPSPPRLRRRSRLSPSSEIASSLTLLAMTRGWVPRNDEKECHGGPLFPCHCGPLFPLSLRAEGVAISVVGHSWRLKRRGSEGGRHGNPPVSPLLRDCVVATPSLRSGLRLTLAMTKRGVMAGLFFPCHCRPLFPLSLRASFSLSLRVLR